MYYRFGKAFYFLSILLFLFFLLYFYSAMPEKVSYNFDENGLSPEKLSKGNFFYGMVAIFILMNVITLLPPKLLETKSHKGLSRIFPVGDKFRDYFLGWFYSFGGILNMALAMVVLYTHAINNQEEIGADQYNLFFYLIPALLVIWVIGLFVILVSKFNQVTTRS
ncbi:DNA topoisomerase IV [Algoriphagus sp.]|uniref:DNA topoisomerase IV n=1 Tax=Algoriphagus sp. TaxID=1872435 RepID=UPI0032823674